MRVNVGFKGVELPGLGLGFLPRPLLFGAGSSVFLGGVSLPSGTSLLHFLPRLLVLATRSAGDGSAPVLDQFSLENILNRPNKDICD